MNTATNAQLMSELPNSSRFGVLLKGMEKGKQEGLIKVKIKLIINRISELSYCENIY